MESLVTVVLPLYRERLDHADMAIKSIVGQTYPHIEVLIILDDPENAELRELALQFAQQDKRVKLIVNEANLGLAETLNKAIAAARGEFVCRMDGDDVSLPNRIDRQLAYLYETGADLVGGYCEVIDDDGGVLYNVDNIPTDPFAVKRALRWNNCVPHPSWLGKTSVFERGYRSYPLCEDYDFLVRAELTGKVVANCPDIVLQYRMSKRGVSRSDLFRQYLAQVFLTRNYQQGRVARIDEAERYIDGRYSPRRDRRYHAAHVSFNDGLAAMRERRLAFAGGKFAACALQSASYCGKVLRLMMAASGPGCRQVR